MTGDHEHTVHMHMRMHMLITPCVGRWVIGFGLGVRLVRRATTGAAGVADSGELGVALVLGHADVSGCTT